MKNITPRQFALQNNLPTYVSDKPCKNGHFSERSTRHSACKICERERRSSEYYDKYKTDDAAFRKQFCDLRGRARQRNIPFTIKLEEIDRPKFCPVLGIELHYEINHNTEDSKWMKSPNRASFDKLIPVLGYVPGNVFIISLEANRLKSNATLEQLESLVAYMKRGIKNGEAV